MYVPRFFDLYVRMFPNCLIVMYVPFSVLCVLFVCKCVLYYCHQMSTQLQSNVYHIISYYIIHKNSSVSNRFQTFVRNVLVVTSSELPLEPWRWRHYLPSKHVEFIKLRRIDIPPNNGAFKPSKHNNTVKSHGVENLMSIVSSNSGGNSPSRCW
jgi:hypothetical protein